MSTGYEASIVFNLWYYLWCFKIDLLEPSFIPIEIVSLAGGSCLTGDKLFYCWLWRWSFLSAFFLLLFSFPECFPNEFSEFSWFSIDGRKFSLPWACSFFYLEELSFNPLFLWLLPSKPRSLSFFISLNKVEVTLLSVGVLAYLSSSDT